MKALFALAAFSILSSVAHATYVVADIGSTNTAPTEGTHVVMSGQGLEDGTGWLTAAHTQALVYRDRSPDSGIRLIAAVDPLKKDAYLHLLRNWGYRNIQYFAQDMTADEVTSQLQALPLIASLDYDGHDAAFMGLALQDESLNHRFYLVNVDKMVGKVHFLKDAVIRLMGCNTGWFLAPYMAKKLGVPTVGTLTSADVEVLGSNQHWYYDETGAQPAGVTSASMNSSSFDKSVTCIAHGGCMRLKPVNSSYYGMHGVYAGSLPFAKFFCGTVAKTDCFRRMALATRFQIGVNSMETDASTHQLPSIKDFAATLADHFCPPAPATLAASCEKAVVNHVLDVQALPQNFTTLGPKVQQLSCDFNTCQFKVVKDSSGQKVLVSTATSASSSFEDELNAYIAGYQTLSQSLQ